MPEEGMAEKLSALRSMIGLEGKPHVFEIEKGAIKKFAEAIGDPNPLWQDKAYAQKSQYGTIVTPPGFLCAHMIDTAGKPEIPPPGSRRLDGGGEWEYIKPIKAGDTITSVTKFSDIKKREGKQGKLYFLIFETTHTNQDGELVAISQGTTISY